MRGKEHDNAIEYLLKSGDRNAIPKVEKLMESRDREQKHKLDSLKAKAKIGFIGVSFLFLIYMANHGIQQSIQAKDKEERRDAVTIVVGAIAALGGIGTGLLSF